MGLVIGYRGHENRLFARGPNWWQVTFPPTRKLPRISYIRVFKKAGQAPMPPHHLAQFGYRRPPHWLWRASPRAFVIVSAIQDIWLVVTGRATLHRAYQAGLDAGREHEYQRVVVNGGR